MKRFLFAMITMILMVSIWEPVMAQTQLASPESTFTYVGGFYQAKQVFNAGLDTTYKYEGKPTAFVKMPTDYGRAVVYCYVDSAGTTDSLNVTVQGSHNGVLWYTNTTLTTVLSTSGNGQYIRKEIAYADRYIRLLNNLGGSYPKRMHWKEYILPIK